MLDHVEPIRAMHAKAAAKAAALDKQLAELNDLHTKIEKQIEDTAAELTAIYNTEKSTLSIANTA